MHITGNKAFLIISLCAALQVVACSGYEEYVSEDELVAYIQDEANGLRQVKRANQLDIQVSYRPNQLLILQEAGPYPDSLQLSMAHQIFDKNCYFTVDLTVEGKNALYQMGSNGSFSELLNTLSFGMSDKVLLTTSNQDTLAIQDYLFNRTYGVGASSLLFAFEAFDPTQVKWIDFHFSEFGMHSGNQVFRFQGSNIAQIPKLKELQIKP